MKQLFSIFLLLNLCLACVPSHPDISKEEARAIMNDVSRRNLAYEPLTEHDDTMMRQVVAYYKKHGTSNEQMEAYYLLGSIYRDVHEAPKAMETFLNGINAADTTNRDCRYDILARLYAQKSNLLHKQSLHKQSTEAIRMVYKYATLAKDTLIMVAAQWERLGNYFAFCNYKAISDECWDVLEESKQMGKYSYGARNLCTAILANIELGHVEDAARLLSIYEKHSGQVDLKTHVSSFPIYYYAKGRVLAATGQLDSAEYFYRKELEASDWNNRQAAYRGLRMLFEQKGMTDSICKYAPLQCDAVDSAGERCVAARSVGSAWCGPSASAGVRDDAGVLPACGGEVRARGGDCADDGGSGGEIWDCRARGSEGRGICRWRGVARGGVPQHGHLCEEPFVLRWDGEGVRERRACVRFRHFHACGDGPLPGARRRELHFG